MNRNKTPDFAEDEKKYMRLNKETQSVPELAAAMKRGAAGVYAYFSERGWKPFKKPQPRKDSAHPFRKANRALEAVCLSRKIENRKANPK